MTKLQTARLPGQQFDVEVCRALDAITTRLLKEPGADLDALIDEYPEYAEQLRHLLPAMQAMVEVGRLSAAGGASSSGSGSTPNAEDNSSALAQGVLGDFRLIREVGRGGMGVVYEAEQVSLGRRVALKVLPFAALLVERQLARFKNEARAAGALHHTNIVPVYFVGCERGVHFYAMQYIEGQTLAQVIVALRAQSRMRGDRQVASVTEEPNAHHDVELTAEFRSDSACLTHSPVPKSQVQTSTPTDTVRDDGLTIILTEQRTNSAAHFRTIARLGIQAAEALEHAHLHGVIHRDIKPANLMLDATCNLWIADFGLARLETDAGMTMTGDLIGTLRYMSPEQALGQRELVDHRTDIYSLGVTLYELLAHAPPFDGDDRAGLLQQIANDEPQRLRRRNRAVPAELETIVHKALEKNPADRYATAQEMADDLRRFLDDKPIHAKPPTFVVRTRKWVRRHKQVVALATAFAVLVMIGAGVAAGLFYQQRAEFTARQERLREADLASQHGLQTLRRAINLARRESNREAEFAFQEAIACLATLCEQFPGDLEFGAEHLVARFHYQRFLLSSLGGEDESDEALRTLAAAFMRLDLSGDMRNTKATFFDLGRCGFQLGSRLAERGEVATAASLFARARECFVRIAPDHQDAQARCLIEWGKCLDQQRQWEEARNLYRQALPILDDWNSTFHTQRNAGAWKSTAYPDMFIPSAVKLPFFCSLQKVFVYQRLGEDIAAKDVLDGIAESIYFPSDPTQVELDAPFIEAAALLDVRHYLPSAGDPRLETTFVKKLLQPATALLLRAGEAVEHDDPTSAEALFEQAIGEAQQANLDVRTHDGFRQMALRLGSSGVDRLQAHANWRDARRQVIWETNLSHTRSAQLAPYPAKIARRQFANAITLAGTGQQKQARSAMETSIAHGRKAIVNEPNHHTPYTLLAWRLATSPVPELQDPHEAIRLAEKSLEIKADSGSALAALGAAHYRLGRWEETVKCFDNIPNDSEIHRDREWRASFFFRAMALWQLGNHGLAQVEFYGVLLAAPKKPPPEFQLIRAEAEALIGVPPPAVTKRPRPPEP